MERSALVRELAPLCSSACELSIIPTCSAILLLCCLVMLLPEFCCCRSRPVSCPILLITSSSSSSVSSAPFLLLRLFLSGRSTLPSCAALPSTSFSCCLPFFISICPFLRLSTSPFLPFCALLICKSSLPLSLLPYKKPTLISSCTTSPSSTSISIGRFLRTVLGVLLFSTLSPLPSNPPLPNMMTPLFSGTNSSSSSAPVYSNDDVLCSIPVFSMSCSPFFLDTFAPLPPPTPPPPSAVVTPFLRLALGGWSSLLFNPSCSPIVTSYTFSVPNSFLWSCPGLTVPSAATMLLLSSTFPLLSITADSPLLSPKLPSTLILRLPSP
mmetsp:Transcript_13545/g.22274  ORF Transcript_13545/g.22274 Transcript_13545/m.22274 type:complete len:325 (-) Transcript_13545:4469-5443(-)